MTPPDLCGLRLSIFASISYLRYTLVIPVKFKGLRLPHHGTNLKVLGRCESPTVFHSSWSILYLARSTCTNSGLNNLAACEVTMRPCSLPVKGNTFIATSLGVLQTGNRSLFIIIEKTLSQSKTTP